MAKKELLAPLSVLLSTMIKYKWSEHEQKVFHTIKQHVSRQTLLTYPDSVKPFDIHSAWSFIQLRAIISQAGVQRIAIVVNGVKHLQGCSDVIEVDFLGVQGSS